MKGTGEQAERGAVNVSTSLHVITEAKPFNVEAMCIYSLLTADREEMHGGDE